MLGYWGMWAEGVGGEGWVDCPGLGGKGGGRIGRGIAVGMSEVRVKVVRVDMGEVGLRVV